MRYHGGNRTFLILLFLLTPLLLSCGGKSVIRPGSGEALSYEPWNTVLAAHLDEKGYVNYAAAKEDKEFWRFIGMLNSAEPSKMTEKEQLAFWINAYNALTWQLIFDNMPLESITDIAGGLVGAVSPLTSPWEIEVVKIEGREWTLQKIEDEKVRKLGDEQVHFAINCASFSCPTLQGEAYTTQNMDQLMEKSRKSYLTDRAQNYLKDGKLYLSKIFDWYKDDFVKDGVSVTTYVAKFWPDANEAKTIAGMKEDNIEYVSYDWKLNSQENEKKGK